MTPFRRNPTANKVWADVDASTAGRLLSQGDAVLVDVREPAEWSAGHAPQATHLPLGDLRAQDVPPAATVIIVCRSGNRSAKAADQLTKTVAPS